MSYRLPGPDFGGLNSFSFQLVSDASGRHLLLANEIIELYLGYCAHCHLERREPQNFSAWLHADLEQSKAPEGADSPSSYEA